MLTLNRAELAATLTIAKHAMARRHTLPVLETVHLIPMPGGAEVRATDLTTRYTGRIACHGGAVGAFCIAEDAPGYCIPYAALAKFAKDAKGAGDTLTIESATPAGAKSPAVKVTCGGRSATIPVIDPHEFPMVPDVPMPVGVIADKGEFAKALGLVAFAAATEERRPILATVRMHFNGRATFAAANGYILSVATFDYAGDATTLLVPNGDGNRGAVPTLAAALGDKVAASDTVLIEHNMEKARAVFSIGRHTVHVALVEGTFPDYTVIVPKRAGTDTVVAAPVGPWLAFVKSAKKFHTLRLEFTPEAATVQGAASTGDEESVTETLPLIGRAAGVAGLTMALAPAYLLAALEALKAAGAGTFVLAATSPQSVVLVEGPDGWQYVQMPMHLGR